MGKQRAIELRTNRTFREKKFPLEGNKLIPKKGEEVRFSPGCVFDEEKTWNRLKFWRSPRKLIFYVKGTVEAIKFNENMKGLNPFWDMGEAGDFVHKLIAKTKAEQKPMKWSQFIILAIMLGVNIVLLIRLQSVIR